VKRLIRFTGDKLKTWNQKVYNILCFYILFLYFSFNKYYDTVIYYWIKNETNNISFYKIFEDKKYDIYNL